MTDQTVATTVERTARAATQCPEVQLQSLFQRGKQLWEYGEYEAAKAAFRQAIKLDAEHTPSYEWLGAVLRELGELREAIRMWRTAETLAPNHPRVLLNLGVGLFELGKFFAASRTDEPLQLLRRAVACSPTPYGRAWFNLGNVLYVHGNYAAARDAYQAALDAEPGLGVAYRNLGNALFRLDQPTAALAAYQRALDAGDTQGAAHHNLGLAALRVRAAETAASAFRAAVTLRPTDGESWLGLGNALAMQGEFQAARAALTEARASRGGQYPEAALDLSKVLLAMGQAEAAVEVLSKQLTVTPLPGLYRQLSRAYIKLGRLPEAVQTLQRFVATPAGDTALGYYELGVALAQCEPPYVAEQAFRTAIEKSHGVYPEAWHRLGRVLMRQNKLVLAVEAFERAIEQRPDFAEALRDLGQALYRSSDLHAADAALNAAIRVERMTGRVSQQAVWEVESELWAGLRQAACLYDLPSSP
ncbi:MAG: tetratricopeptide repeat protein [Chloracidobacterium sp.]|nr:tetratricopeptide repeat protein [Chloracidobacterium sp.]MDW8216598.1 tetratricopeptide repeat protein [Acidobacteriota bacterium]